MVEKITEALLRRRSEHNDGELSTLKEVSLHQFDIVKIENLDVYCRNLEILYLQSNQISKIENLHKLKSLKYLQLALNNITIIENLSGCESLEKLDFTVNFISDLTCVENLVENERLRYLYLVGNPCTSIEGYRSFVIATLPQLEELDGIKIEKSERIIAMQRYAALWKSLHNAKKNNKAAPNDSPETAELSIKDIEQTRADFQSKPVAHTPEARLQAAKELDLLRQKEDKTFEKKKKKEAILVGPDGRIYQKNEGKWQFNWKETKKTIKLSVQISKFLDTSKIAVDVHPNYVRVTIKEKILQLLFPEEVKSDQYHCERSRLTGELVVNVQKANNDDNIDLSKEMGKIAVNTQFAIKSKSAKRHSRYKDFVDPVECVDFRNITKQENKPKTPGIMVGNILEKATISKNQEEIEFIDDPDVPPLC